MTRGEDTRRQCHSKGWTRRGHEKTVPFEGVDDDPRRGHEKTVPFEGVDEERTREDSAIRRGGR